MKSGIDISTFNTIDYANLKCDFAIVRAGYGKYTKQKDDMFEKHYSNLHPKMPIGAYWYSYAMSADEAKQEAKACIEVIKGKKFELPIYYDVEESNQFKLGKAKVSEIIAAFCSELEKAGYYTGFYTSASWYNSVIDDNVKKKYACWIAHWNVTKPNINGKYGIWQYKVGQYSGCKGDVDLDYMYEDYPTIIKNAGLNGYTKTTPTPNKKTITVQVEQDGIVYKGTISQI